MTCSTAGTQHTLTDEWLREPAVSLKTDFSRARLQPVGPQSLSLNSLSWRREQLGIKGLNSFFAALSLDFQQIQGFNYSHVPPLSQVWAPGPSELCGWKPYIKTPNLEKYRRKGPLSKQRWALWTVLWANYNRVVKQRMYLESFWAILTGWKCVRT